MSNAKQLELYKQPAIPGVTFEPRIVRFEGEVAHATVGRFLVNLWREQKWWVADYLNEANKRGWSTVFFEENMGDTQFRDYRYVSEFYPAEFRTYDLSFTHYLEAKEASANQLDAALAWLELAVKDKLSVSQMRERIRRANNDPADPGPLPRSLNVSDLERVSRLCRSVKFEDLAPSAVEIIRANTSPLYRFLQRVHEAKA